MVGRGAQAHFAGLVHVAQKLALLFDGLLAAALDALGALDQFGRLVALIAALGAAVAVGGAVLGLFRPARPLPGAAGGLAEAADLTAQALFLGALRGLAALALAQIVGKAAAQQRRAAVLQGQHVVAAGVEQVAVVRSEDEAALAGKVAAQSAAALRVQMVGRLVDEGHAALDEEQRREQRLHALAAAEGVERAVERALVKADAPRLALDAPVLRAADGGHGRARGQRCVFHGKGKAGKARGGVDAPARVQFAGKQLQKRGLAAAVAAGERQFPSIVQFQRQAAEHRFRRALVGKCQIVYADDGHKKSPFRVQGRGQRRRRAGEPLRVKKDAPSRKDRHAKAAHCAPMACRFYASYLRIFSSLSLFLCTL